MVPTKKSILRTGVIVALYLEAACGKINAAAGLQGLCLPPSILSIPPLSVQPRSAIDEIATAKVALVVRC